MTTHKAVLPVPPSVNRMYRMFRGRVYISKQGKEYKDAVKAIVTRQKSVPFAASSSVVVVVRVYRAARRGDLDNFMKCLLDSLQGLYYQNDNQIVKLIAERYDDKLNPRVEVEVSQYNG